MAKNESKFRKKKLGFTALPNHVLFDDNLDEDSVFLYAIIQYHITIPDFDLYKSYLVKLCKDRRIGQRKFERMWKNLKDVGYLKQYKMNGKGGEWFYEYELLDYPQTIDNTDVIPDTQNVHVVENDIDHTLQNVDVQNEDMVNGDVKNVGTINNNIINNNVLNNNLVDNNITRIKEEWLLYHNKEIHQSILNLLCTLLKHYDIEMVSLLIDLSTNSTSNELLYIKGIVRKWKENNIKTIDDYFNYEENRK